jgi:hypothetical protein
MIWSTVAVAFVMLATSGDPIAFITRLLDSGQLCNGV